MEGGSIHQKLISGGGGSTPTTTDIESSEPTYYFYFLLFKQIPFYWANVISFDKKFAVVLVHNAYFPLHIFTKL